MTLRLAGAGDLALLTSQAPDFFSGSKLPRPTPSRLEAVIRHALERGSVAVIDDDSGYVGSLALELGRFDWSDEVVLRDLWFHVRRDRRGSSAARRLVAFGLALARRRGVALYLGNSFAGRLLR